MAVSLRVFACLFGGLVTAVVVTFAVLSIAGTETESAIFWSTLIYPIIAVTLVVLVMRFQRLRDVGLFLSVTTLAAAAPLLI